VFLRQTAALIGIAVASIPSRPGSASVLAVSVACAVAVLVSTLSIGAGIEMMTMKNVRNDRVILRSTSGGQLPRSAAQVAETLPGIKSDVNGEPLVSADVVLAVQARKKTGGSKATVTVVGVSRKYDKVYPEIRVTAGRAFQSGLHELIVGSNAWRNYRGLNIGERVTYQGVRWEIVGTFEAAGGLAESWMLTDAEMLRSAFNRDGYEQMTVMLASPASFGALAGALRSIPTLDMELKREIEVRQRQSRSLNGVVNFVSYFVGLIMAIGAMMGAANSMYAMVDSRRRDFATLRALGFRSSAILAAVLAEAVILAGPASLVGVLVPWLAFNGNPASFVGLNFSLAVTPGVAASGVAVALAIGLVGAMVPAFNAARVPIARGLHAL